MNDDAPSAGTVDRWMASIFYAYGRPARQPHGISLGTTE